MDYLLWMISALRNLISSCNPMAWWILDLSAPDSLGVTITLVETEFGRELTKSLQHQADSVASHPPSHHLSRIASDHCPVLLSTDTSFFDHYLF